MVSYWCLMEKYGLTWLLYDTLTFKMLATLKGQIQGHSQGQIGSCIWTPYMISY